MSLAEELLADLEEGGEDIADELQESDETKLEDIAEEVEDVSMQVDSDNVNSIHSIAKLRDSRQVLILHSFSTDAMPPIFTYLRVSLYDVDIEASACVLNSRYALLCYAMLCYANFRGVVSWKSYASNLAQNLFV